MPIISCHCEAAAIRSCQIAHHSFDVLSLTRLMQFLMGLNYHYDRSQILGIEPLLLVKKPYAMVLRVEKQKEIHFSINDTSDNAAMFVRSNISKSAYSVKDDKKPKKKGHTQDTCFKLVGVPDW